MVTVVGEPQDLDTALDGDEARFNEYERAIVANVRESGWHCTSVGDDLEGGHIWPARWTLAM